VRSVSTASGGRAAAGMDTSVASGRTNEDVLV
jgi:hypothetical protein